jgi:hypothetical protein
MKNPQKRPPGPRLVVLLAIAAAAALLTLVCGLGAFWVLREVDSFPPLIAMWMPTATVPPFPVEATSTALPVLSTPTPTRTPPWTATPAPSRTPMPTLTATPLPSPTPAATRTPLRQATPTSTVVPSPTPYLCEGIEDLVTMRLAPGQRFECTIRQETLTALAESYEDSPCTWTRIALDDGEINVQCQRGLTMSATLSARAKECRLELQVLRGTLGFAGVIQRLLDTQFNAIRYDEVCVNKVDIDDGNAYIAGYGR